jgi:hypothetical protein
MAKIKSLAPFLFCIKNESYPASLEVGKVYRSVPDATAAARHMVRVIDESGENGDAVQRGPK